MQLAALIAILLLIATLIAGAGSRLRSNEPRVRGRGHLRGGARRLYSRRNFLKLAGATGGAAVLAYSGADEAVEAWHRDHVASDATKRVAEQFKQFGENYWVGVWLAMALADRLLPSTELSRFGRRCLEATALGLPVLWTTQRVLGGSRPSDESHGPRFRPFFDENTVSGHTFIAAVPWLVLARQLRPSSARGAAVLLSPVTGWTRLHDRKHYPSQVMFGWALAWEATGAVCATADASVETPS